MYVNPREIQTRLHYRMWRTNVLLDRLAKAMTPGRFVDVAAFYSAVLIAVVLPSWNFWQVLAAIAASWTGARCLKDAREVWRSLKG